MVLAQHVCPMGESRGFLVGPVISGRCDLMNDGTTATKYLAPAAANSFTEPRPGRRKNRHVRRRENPGPPAGTPKWWLGTWWVVAGGSGCGGWLPLVVVLVLQAGLSVRLVGADTAFQDEAEYLWAGHLEWSHWLHGTVVPPFASYFSGAPGIYPPLAALADRPAGWPPRGCCRWCSCWGPRRCCGRPRDGCSGAAPRSSPARCSRCQARRCTWARSRPTTRCRCSAGPGVMAGGLRLR